MSKKRFGVMLDMSRNAVMTIDEIKKYADTISALGYNMIQLYTEDTYEVDGEPYFGYLRGRYSKQELKEIDEYCAKKGIEVIPCIQTLAHLNAIFRWNEYSYHALDVNDILLIDEPRVYALIENMFVSLKECFRSNIVHVGMDEAHMVGLGKYLDKHGYKNRFDILVKHLNKVMEIAKKYGFSPLMWSDMFFRLINHGDYYLEGDTQPELVDNIKDKIPDGVGLVYWDYYNTENSMYDKMFKAHKRMSKDVWFAGGAWTWRGFAPSNNYTLITMLPAMQECNKHDIDNVIITMWGDDGAECSRYAVLPSLYYIKRVYDGENDIEVIKREFKQITGEDFDAMMALDEPNYQKESDKTKPVAAGKNLLYNDLFRGVLDTTIAPECVEHYAETAKKLGEYKKNSKYSYVFETLEKLCLVLEKKTTLGIKIRRAYSENDVSLLKKCVGEIDVVLDRVGDFYYAFRKQWMRENKPHGFDVQDIRLGGLMRRLKSCKEMLLEYIDDKTDKIPELEEQLLPYPNIDSSEKGAIGYHIWTKIATINCVEHK